MSLNKMPGISNITSISCGQCHALFLNNAGILYSLGVGINGRLGHGNKLSYSEPKIVMLFIFQVYYR